MAQAIEANMAETNVDLQGEARSPAVISAKDIKRVVVMTIPGVGPVHCASGTGNDAVRRIFEDAVSRYKPVRHMEMRANIDNNISLEDPSTGQMLTEIWSSVEAPVFIADFLDFRAASDYGFHINGELKARGIYDARAMHGSVPEDANIIEGELEDGGVQEIEGPIR